MAGTLDLETLLERVQRRATQVLPCDSVATFYWDAKASVFRMISQYGVPAEMLPALQTLEFSPTLPFVERLTSTPILVIGDVREQDWVPAELFAGFQINALLAAQLRVRGRAVGALVATRRIGGFDSDQVQLFEGIARHVAVAIETAELYRSQQEEAAVSGALAQAGQELIAVFNITAILERLCQLTTTLLECEFGHTFLWQQNEAAYVPVSGYGDTPEQWESLQVVRVPRAVVAGLLAALESEDVVQVVMSEPQGLLPAALPLRYGITVAMYLALRRGSEIIGIQTAGYRGRQQPFAPRQLRIARGIAQLASLALDHSRLTEELERANHLKSEFLATMSHELRTPLNMIIGYNELMLSREFGSITDQQAEVLRRVEKSSRDLLDLINATLDLSRLEARRDPVNVAELHVDDLIRELQMETQLPVSRQQLQLVWRVGAELPPLQTDALKLKVVLKNLIGNAIKFTERGTVRIEACERDGGIECCVSDTGIGIAPDSVPEIFEAFRQLDSSMTRTYEGVGLGLYIVRRLVDILDGTITVESALGRGTTFRVWLPRVPTTASDRHQATQH